MTKGIHRPPGILLDKGQGGGTGQVSDGVIIHQVPGSIREGWQRAGSVIYHEE